MIVAGSTDPVGRADPREDAPVPAVSTYDLPAFNASADIDLAERELLARTKKLEAVKMILGAARASLDALSAGHPARARLLERYQDVKELLLKAAVDRSDEMSVL